MAVNESVFWTDSTAVLKYIKNDDKWFHTFPTNRLAVIHSGSVVSQWHRFGLHMQPVVVVVGSVTTATASYVVVDNITWKLATPLKAVDVCFKAFHVFHASYPAESHVWQLLQKAVYKFSTKWDIKSAAVSAVMSDLK